MSSSLRSTSFARSVAKCSVSHYDEKYPRKVPDRTLPLILSIGEFYVVEKRRSTDFEALHCRNARSGSYFLSIYMFFPVYALMQSHTFLFFILAHISIYRLCGCMSYIKAYLQNSNNFHWATLGTQQSVNLAVS